ncbi:hypothetical protein ACLGEH_00560 [Helicobacter pylori]
MDKNRDVHAIMANVIKPLEMGGSFNSSDRVKFVQVARTLGIEDSVIEEIIDASDLPREQKKAVRAELQKSINENLKALENIKNNI